VSGATGHAADCEGVSMRIEGDGEYEPFHLRCENCHGYGFIETSRGAVECDCTHDNGERCAELGCLLDPAAAPASPSTEPQR